jgi:protein-disulfide isomerase/uncharacterized membrane protein
MLGVFASAYLLVDYVFGSGICLTGSGCDTVRSSAFAYPLGIPMPLLGLGYYIAALALVLVRRRRVFTMPAGTLAAGWSLLGLLVMVALTAIEVFVIRALCSWCLLSAVASMLLAGGSIAALRGRDGGQAEEPRSSRTRRRLQDASEQADRSLRRFAVVGGTMLSLALLLLLALPAALTGGAAVDESKLSALDRPRLGSGTADVVVFSDFQCPACAIAAPILTRLADDGSISLTFRYFPLTSIHANANAAAGAAQAAALQDRFWQFHDALFSRQATWAELPGAEADAVFEQIASEIGLDVARWRSDTTSPAVTDVVTADAREAQDLQLSGTPTIFIDGRQYDGGLSLSALQQAVAAAGLD